ncbi:MAG TPA: hypothetical protein PK967_10305 [Candidatus Hydrogenedentes bacterium]|nr:hypothetical protein [Candidatus Hydrogenedentota bacterium]
MIIAFVAGLVIVDPADALESARDHTTLTLRIIGVDNESSAQALVKYLDDFSSTIDTARGLQSDDLKAKIREKTPELAAKLPEEFSSILHRFFFHWGYNAGGPLDDSAKPFRDRFDEKFSDLRKKGQLTENEINELRKVVYEIVAHEWNEVRKPILKDATTGAFGLPSEKTTALATIIYEVHILADFTTPDNRIDALSELNFHVRKELVDNGLTRLFRGTHESTNADATISEIVGVLGDSLVDGQAIHAALTKEDAGFQNLFSHVGDVATKLGKDQRRALRILLILKQQFPPLFGKAFGQQLKSKGVTITYSQGLFGGLFR